MKIKLMVKGVEKTFSAPFISARKLKETIQLESLKMDTMDEKIIDIMANYIVSIFGKQFTVDDLMDGIPSDDLIPKFTECVATVTGNLNKKLGELNSPNV